MSRSTANTDTAMSARVTPPVVSKRADGEMKTRGGTLGSLMSTSSVSEPLVVSASAISSENPHWPGLMFENGIVAVGPLAVTPSASSTRPGKNVALCSMGMSIKLHVYCVTPPEIPATGRPSVTWQSCAGSRGQSESGSQERRPSRTSGNERNEIVPGPSMFACGGALTSTEKVSFTLSPSLSVTVSSKTQVPASRKVVGIEIVGKLLYPVCSPAVPLPGAWTMSQR